MSFLDGSEFNNCSGIHGSQQSRIRRLTNDSGISMVGNVVQQFNACFFQLTDSRFAWYIIELNNDQSSNSGKCIYPEERTG